MLLKSCASDILEACWIAHRIALARHVKISVCLEEMVMGTAVANLRMQAMIISTTW
jgi:hypothetical protein